MDALRLFVPRRRWHRQKPAAVETRVIEIAATVENLDCGEHTITWTIHVGDRVQNLDQIKKGGQVVVRRTETVAASVTKSVVSVRTFRLLERDGKRA